DQGNNVTSTLDDNRVADANVTALADGLAALAESLDIIFVVERRVGDHHAANGDRLKAGHGRERARAAHLDVDATENGECLLGWKFMRNCPAGAARAEPKAVLEIETVKLIVNTINVVVELRAFEADGA